MCKKNSLSMMKKMTKAEAQNITKSIRDSHKNMTREITMIYVLEGYRKLGYSNFKSYVLDCLPEVHYPTLLFHAKNGKVSLELGGWDIVGLYSGNAMVPFRKLNTMQGQEVWKYLKDEADTYPFNKKWLTEKRVKKTVSKLFPEKLKIKPSWKEKSSEFKKALNSPYKIFEKRVVDIMFEMFSEKNLHKALEYMNKRITKKNK